MEPIDELTSKSSQRFSTARLLVLLGGVLVVALVIAVVWYFFLRNDSYNLPFFGSAEVTSEITSTQKAEVQPEAVESLDDDADGLSNELEQELGTNDKLADTDGDGILDGEELYGWKTDPLKKDTDGDGLSDYDEVKVFFTDPLEQDTDGDGYSDYVELGNGYDPAGG